MNKKIGIPRALFYYQYYPLWKVFFEELGAEVIVSDYTTKKIVDDGVSLSVDEACLPVKLFYGHVLNIKDKVDYLFIPRMTSISKNEYICPKFGGLPDMIRNTMNNLPEIIDVEINLRKSNGNVLKAIIEIGKFFTQDVKSIKYAYEKALENYNQFKKRVRQGIVPTDILEKKFNVIKNNSEYKLNIALIGHVYNIYDKYSSMNLIEKLKNDDINIITIDMIDSEIINENVKALKKQMFWNYGRKAIGTALHLIERDDIDGVIYLMAFGCGIDSFVCDMVERRIRKNSEIPFIVLNIDEHSGEAGMNTRLEAFTDMIRWRYKNEDNVSAYG
ncbi:acyl-CoA dehydratase activase-related protein [Herbivorax sp. ANBcel31]|uniref:acyl-CoA dehydratase activase-related protein n=1 Tax=Herbivorax sp. ANBcel31 TaxID=3069754 RepID=UPI0027B38F69|nr:acyl-CoA dehydratase activase-related protein [Herbivorax sp. ANBcel31]MDQ2085479.1 acyl-CoA dehydratase activase-related protein [Herbivorax sp. ANBcel31]